MALWGAAAGWSRFFEKYGVCAECPSAASGLSIAASIGLPLLLAMIFAGLFVLRSMMPRGMMKVCVCCACCVACLLWVVHCSNV